MGAIVLKGYKELGLPRDTILLNSKKPSTNQLFTLAHEFGHYILGHHKQGNGVLFRIDFFSDNYPDDKKVQTQELEANYFAGAILMPRDVILKYKDKLHNREIAEELGVSESAVATRIDWINKNSD